MIFPFLNGVLNFHKSPVTWSLIFINASIFLFSSMMSKNVDGHFQSLLDNDQFMLVQGKVYAEFLDNPYYKTPNQVEQLVELAKEGRQSKYRILGRMALGDARFMSEAGQMAPFGDKVAFGWWRAQFNELTQLMGRHPSYVLGVNAENSEVFHWLTYQFSHSGFIHFFGNMIFLLIFGSFLEPLLGGLAFLVVYLLSGMVAAGVFLFISGVSMTPLVGASGAISGLMALFGFVFWNRPVRYIYFLLIPLRGYSGFVYLPAWITLILWVVPDLAGYFADIHLLGGVAHAAHLGGELAGMIVGICFYFLGIRSRLIDTPSDHLKGLQPFGTRAL